MKSFWNDRYAETEYVYGEDPNIFFAEQLKLLKPGIIILSCEGEGRNAVFAANNGWKVFAFDSSEEGKAKAMKLAEKKGALLDYLIGDAAEINSTDNSADVVALIYAHLPLEVRKQLHQKAVQWLKPGGRLILEAFNPAQLGNTSGGPKDLTLLYTENILKQDFEGLQIEFIQTLQTTLNEGKYHEGKADIIQFIGIKI
jgi:SAM-dependent methyltransferase